MSDRVQCEPVKQTTIVLRLGVAHLEVGNERAGVRGCHAGTQAQL